jgi:hypothetical protein
VDADEIDADELVVESDDSMDSEVHDKKCQNGENFDFV